MNVFTTIATVIGCSTVAFGAAYGVVRVLKWIDFVNHLRGDIAKAVSISKQETVDEITEKISLLHTILSEALGKLNERISAIEKQVNYFEDRLKFDFVSTDFERIRSLEKGFELSDIRVSSSEDRLSTLENDNLEHREIFDRLAELEKFVAQHTDINPED